MQSKTLTILLADIQGYTSRTSQQTREEMELFINETHSFIKKHVKNHEGRLVKTMGDGFLAAFESPTNAVKCGLSIQKEVSRRNANILESDNFIRFRVGVCTGEVNIDDKGDVYGDAVNIAARIESFAEPNHVFISESTFLSMNHSEVSALDLGPQQFKNVVREIRVYRVLHDDDEMSLDTVSPRKQETTPSKYRYLAWGLSAGIFLAAILIAGVFFSRNNDPGQPVPETSQPLAQTVQPENFGSRRSRYDDVAKPDRPVKAQKEPIKFVSQKEINELFTGLVFLKWAVKTEEK